MSKTARKLTEEDKQEYLNSRGNICPYCRSDNISATGYMNADDLTAHRKVECFECGEEWLDVYTLTEVEEA